MSPAGARIGGSAGAGQRPYRIAFHGFAPGIDAATAQAAKGGNGGNGGGNNGSGNGGNGGNDSGNGSGGNNGKGNPGSGSGDDGGGQGPGQGDKGASHVNATTGDRVDVDGNKITVEHPDGMTEQIENGRFKMRDALGRMIIDRRATPADVSRLKAL
ncbi:hypothetical protein ACVDG5_027350 [Mesorhizobium sp. ORM6]